MKLPALPTLALGGAVLTAALGLLPSSASAVAFETGFTCSPGAGPSYEVCGADMLAVQGMNADPAWDVVFEDMRHIEPAAGSQLPLTLAFEYDATLAGLGGSFGAPLVLITGIALTEMNGVVLNLPTSGPMMIADLADGFSYSATFDIPAGAPTYVHDFHVSCEVNTTAAMILAVAPGITYDCSNVLLASFTFGADDGVATLTPGVWTTPPPMPEPGSIALIGAGLLGAFAATRRRRKPAC